MGHILMYSLENSYTYTIYFNHSVHYYLCQIPSSANPHLLPNFMSSFLLSITTESSYMAV